MHKFRLKEKKNVKQSVCLYSKKIIHVYINSVTKKKKDFRTKKKKYGKRNYTVFGTLRRTFFK